MEPKFNVAICGGGNLAHGCIATIAHRNPNYEVKLLSRRPQIWKKEIVAHTAGSDWEKFGNLTGQIKHVSDKAEEVVTDADIILICSPAHTKGEILTQIKPHVKQGAIIGTVFGQGAFDWQVQGIFGNEMIKEKNLTIFSLQYVPFICKVMNYGSDIQIIGPKRTLYAAAFPVEKVHYVCNALSQSFHLPCIPIPSFLNLTLCPSNQIIHPGRVTGFFQNMPEGCATVMKKKDVPLLYEGLDQASADEIQFLDDEIQAIKKAILAKYPLLNLDQVMPLKERICTMYGGQVSDPSTLKTVFNTNQGYRVVPFPMIPVEGQDLTNIPAGDEDVHLNLNHRFFFEDMPFGLVILKSIGNIVGVQTPAITKNIVFHQKYMTIKYVDEATNELIDEAVMKSGAPHAYGITTFEQLVETSLSQDKKQIDNSENVFFNKREGN